MSDNKSIQQGLCCMNTILRSKPLYLVKENDIKNSRTTRKDALKEKIIQNLEDTLLLK